MADVPDYPADLERALVLRDGRTVRLRPIHPDDDPRYRDFALALSPESVYFRFFSPKTKLSEREIEHFLNVDYASRLGLVAVAVDPDTAAEGRLVGVGRYDRTPETADADVAFIVADDYQGQGIATAMLRLLARAARRHDIRRFTASVLPENRRMLGVFTDSGWVVERHFDGGLIDIALNIRRDDRR